MINEIQPKIKFQNIVQCPFKVTANKFRKKQTFEKKTQVETVNISQIHYSYI